MIIAGLTGSIGTGKSTVARMFKELGAFVIDADDIARKLVEPGTQVLKEITAFFGEDILNGDGTLNRRKLASIVFKDKKKLQKLNSIVHPAVINEAASLAEQRKIIDPDGLVIQDMPLLLELGPKIVRQIVDLIIVTYVSPDVQLKRLIARGMTETDARNRIGNQIPFEDKVKSADYVIDNNGSIEETLRQVKQVFDSIIKKGHS